jgi:hypothetical protein
MNLQLKKINATKKSNFELILTNKGDFEPFFFEKWVKKKLSQNVTAQTFINSFSLFFLHFQHRVHGHFHSHHINFRI